MSTHRHGDQVADVAAKEDDARGGVDLLVGHTETRPHGIVGHRAGGGKQEAALRQEKRRQNRRAARRWVPVRLYNALLPSSA
jgi:hypothetical protein